MQDLHVTDAPRTLHSVREDAFDYVWDNSIEPALEVDDGAVVELHVRDASDEQIRADSGPEDVTRLDFDHVNPVSGPVFSLGDTHAAQGDGEVCGTAIETAMDVVVRLSVRRDFQIDAPESRLPAGALAASEQSAHHVCTGVGPDLMEAATDAVRAAIRHLEEEPGLGREEAYALCSVAVDLRIHEIVDAPNWVVGTSALALLRTLSPIIPASDWWPIASSCTAADNFSA